MQIEVLFFGVTRDLVGQNDLALTVTDAITVAQLKVHLANKYAGLNDYNYAVAVNEAYAEDDTPLKNADVVALIPPVSGG